MSQGYNPWIKVWLDILSDPKMHQLTLAEFGFWIKALLLCAQSPERGKLMVSSEIPYTNENIASTMHLSEDDKQVMETALDKLQRLGCIRCGDDGALEIVHFNERQYTYPSWDPTSRKQKRARNPETPPPDKAPPPKYQGDGAKTYAQYKEEERQRYGKRIDSTPMAAADHP